ncbi:S41 family peptidase [Pedobacter sp. AW31-3R]|uniref:S41 family peptidase n=1 Tax=Pedobacter sp. AW31-3R TaxID=3445781 RepID=UPI003FA0B890
MKGILLLFIGQLINIIKYLFYDKTAWAPAILLLLILSCKKEMPVVAEQAERSADQRLKDSIYYYYKRYSLWTDSAALDDDSVFSFTDTYDSPSAVLNALKGMTPFHALYRGGIDRFSYLADAENGGKQSFGLFLSIGAVGEKKAYPVVYFVEGGSPADLAGIRRSDVVLSIDDNQDLGIPVTCSDAGCQVDEESVYQTVISRLLKAMAQPGMRIRIRHADAAESTIQLSSNRYAVNPVITHKVFSYPDKAIAYLALSSFEEASVGSINRSRLEQVFNSFEQQQVNDLIVDLRYNTGGDIRTVEYIANKVITEGGNRNLMFRFILNAYLKQHPQAGGNSFDDVYFRRNNHLNLNTVYFLVTDVTASAAELLINVLRPYMNVVIIAEHEGTYGKPVGFFKQEIMGKAALWAASFKLVNARGETDYWDGIGADQRNVVDNIFRDFGNMEESMVRAAVNHALGRTTSSTISSMVAKTILPLKGRISNVNVVREKEMLMRGLGN